MTRDEVHVPDSGSDPVPGPLPSRPGPWPFAASLGWLVALVGLMLVVQSVAAVLPLLGKALVAAGQGRRPSFGGVELDGNLLFVAQLACTAAVLPSVWWLAHLRETGRTREYLGLRGFTWKHLVLGALGTGVVLGISSFLVGEDNATMRDLLLTASPKFPLWIAMVVLAPVVEEAVFRGFVFEGLSRVRGGAWTASVLTSLLWASIHLQYDLKEMTVIFLFGLVLGGVRGASGSVWPCLILHAVNNALSAAAFELEFQKGLT